MAQPTTLAAALALPPAERYTWIVFWNGACLGLMDDVTPDIKLKFAMISSGTTGPGVPLGWRFEGTDGSIKCQARQITADLQHFVLPWNASNGATSSLTPPLNTDLYSFAAPLILHPNELGNVTSQDLIFPKACPVTLPSMKRNGKNDDVWEIEFYVMVDRTALATNPTVPIIGYLGQ